MVAQLDSLFSDHPPNGSNQVLYARVINIQRYLSYNNPFSLADNEEDYIYDLTLSDSHYVLKSILHPSMNHFILLNIIQIDSIISIEEYKIWLDESVLGGRPNPILMSINPAENQMIEKTGNETMLREMNDKPMMGDLEYYVPLWNNDCFDENHPSIFPHRFPVTSETEIEILSNRRINIKELQENFNSNSYSKSLHSEESIVIGRIVSKSVIYHFPNPKKKAKYPMNFKLRIQDSTGQIAVTFWNATCARYYYCCQVGMVIAIENFKLQKRYNNFKFPLFHMDRLFLLSSYHPYISPHPPPSLPLIREEERGRERGRGIIFSWFLYLYTCIHYLFIIYYLPFYF